MGRLLALFLLMIPLWSGFYLMLSSEDRFSPNNWRGLLRSPRFWGGWALMLSSALLMLGAAFGKPGSIF